MLGHCDQLSNEKYYNGKRIKVYLDKVVHTSKGPQLSISRTHPNLVVRLLVDDDCFTITSTADGVEVDYGDTSSEPDLVIRTEYEAFLDAGEGRILPQEFASHHLEIVDGAPHMGAFLALMGAAMSRS